MNSADESPNPGALSVGTIDAELLSVALIGPDEEGRWAMSKALGETRRANVREFDSYPPKLDDLRRLLESFNVIVIDLDSDTDVALELVEKASASVAATIMVYSKKADPKLAVRFMRAGAREYLLLPLERDAVAEALARITNIPYQTAPVEKALPAEKSLGRLLVFVGSKGGSGVTTVACNIAIAVAQKSEQSTLLIDLALPIGDAALCLGIAADYSTEDALRNIDRLDSSFLQELLVRHRSGVYVLAAPTQVPEVEVSKDAVARLIAVARREFDEVIVDLGSRTDVAAKALFKEASTIYMVTQTGISELRNSNRFISQFFADGGPKLEIVINRYEPRVLDAVNEDVIAKALGRPVRWKIPNDWDAARELQYGETGLADTNISRVCLEMAGSITGQTVPQDKKKGFALRGLGRSIAKAIPGNEDPPSITTAPASARTTPTVSWPTPDPITYGDTLTAAQLNATASVEGTFVYTPGEGYGLRAGTHTLWVAFTPADSAGDAPLRAAVSIVVDKATPVLSWATPAEITYGTALDENQLNASASVPGTFEYSPEPGEVLAAGTHELAVTFTPADSANYATIQGTVPLTVAKAASAVLWKAPQPITYGTLLSGAQLCATSWVQGSIEYNPGSGVVLAAGEHNLSAVFTPADTLDYSISHTAVSLTVTKATPAIVWPAPDTIAHGTALSATQLNATATVPGSFAYTPAAGEILAPGVHELSLTFIPTDTLNYTTEHAVVSLTVTEKLPTLITWPAPAAISYGAALSAAQLNATASVPGTFVYTPAAGHVLAPGKYTLSVLFTPADTEKYATARVTVVLEVEGLPGAASLQTAAAQPPSTRSVVADRSAAADSAPAKATGGRAITRTNQRETRTYKGAVYEKGEDGQWHLHKN